MWPYIRGKHHSPVRRRTATDGMRGALGKFIGSMESISVARGKVVSRDVTSSVTGREKKKSRRVCPSTRLLTRMFPNGSSTLTLKQRLTALTQPPSPSSSPRSSPIRRKFSAPWVKRTVAPCGHQNEDRLQVIISKMIYQAGVDYEYAYPHVMILQSLTNL
jgi:hypothetical protein